MAICRSCGAEIPDNAAFCTNCGARVVHTPEPQSFTPDEPTTGTFQAPFPPRQEQPFPPRQEQPLPPRQEQPFPPRQEQPFPPRQEQPFPPRQEQPFPPRQEPFRPQPEISAISGETPPAGKKKNSKKLLLIIGGAVLLVALVLGILFLTGVLGGGSGSELEGVWVLRDPGSSGLKAGDIVLDIGSDGTGTATIKGKPSPLVCKKDSISIDGASNKMTLDGEDLILEYALLGRLVFQRGDLPEEPKPAATEIRPAEEPAEVTEEPAVEKPEAVPATPMPQEPPVNESGNGPYWNLPAFEYATGRSFPFGPWGGVYVYNGNFFKTYFQLNEDYTCSRTIYRNGAIVTDEVGVFKYEDNKIKLYMNGETSVWTEYEIKGEMMVNNNHEFFRQDPGGLIGAWVGDYYYNNKHIHTTYILRTDGTYSEVTYRDEEKVTDNEGTWTFDGSTLKLKATDTPNITTPFTYKNGVLVNNNYNYYLS